MNNSVDNDTTRKVKQETESPLNNVQNLTRNRIYKQKKYYFKI